VYHAGYFCKEKKNVITIMFVHYFVFRSVVNFLFRSENVINLVDLPDGWCVDRLPCAV
jgi:hypothetical protein